MKKQCLMNFRSGGLSGAGFDIRRGHLVMRRDLVQGCEAGIFLSDI